MSDGRVGAIVLAGGRSSRMGKDKATVIVDGVAMLDRVVRAVRDALGVSAPLVVVGGRSQVLDEVDGLDGATLVRDVADFEGPLHGLRHGLAAASAQGWSSAYLAACDHARLTAAHVRWCVETLGAPHASPPADPHAHWAVCPMTGGHLRPLASAVRVDAAFARAQKLVDGGQRSARALFMTRGVLTPEAPDADAIRSHDRPTDL